MYDNDGTAQYSVFGHLILVILDNIHYLMHDNDGTAQYSVFGYSILVILDNIQYLIHDDDGTAQTQYLEIRWRTVYTGQYSVFDA